MSALGELLIYIIYGALVLFFLSRLSLAIFHKRKKSKNVYGVLALISVVSLLYFSRVQKKNRRANEEANVGKYHLSNYPNCPSCNVILKEDNTFEIVDSMKVLEKGDWSYESGGDFWIVYLDKRKDQLGSGIYKYDSFNLQVSKKPAFK